MYCKPSGEGIIKVGSKYICYYNAKCKISINYSISGKIYYKYKGHEIMQSPSQ